MPGDVFSRQWLFKPEQVELLPHRRAANGFCRSEAFIGVHHEGAMRSKYLANSSDAFDVFGRIRLADFDLGSSKTGADDLTRFFDELIKRMIEPTAIGIIDRHFVAIASQQPVKRYPGNFGFQVPNGDVYSSKGEHGDSAASNPIHAPPHFVPDLLIVQRIHTAD